MPPGADEVERRIDRLRETFGDGFPVETETYDLDERGHERALERREWGVVATARVWVERGDTVALVRDRSDRRPDAWTCPGGMVEADESVLEGGRREVREETGLDCTVRDVAAVQRAKLRPPPDADVPPTVELAAALVAEYEGGTLRPEPDEIAAAAWFRDLPADLVAPADRIAAERF